LVRQSRLISEIYEIKKDGFTDTSYMSPEQVAADIAKVILFDEYLPKDLERTRDSFEKGHELHGSHQEEPLSGSPPVQ
jgi:hypothetical protein